MLVDRGSAFVSSQLLRACAVLGAKLIHASPRAATTKGKIERFFRTCRDQFLVEIERPRRPRAERAQPALRRLAGGRLSPPRAFGDRADAAGAVRAAGAPGAADPGAAARGVSCGRETRTVTKTATVSLLGQRIRGRPGAGRPPLRAGLRPVRSDRGSRSATSSGRSGSRSPLQIGRHTHPQAERQLEPPATPTGIDYLGLLAARRDGELGGQRIDYAQLADPDDHNDDAERGGRAGEHRQAQSPLRVHEDAVRQGPRPGHAARPPRPRRRRSRGSPGVSASRRSA